MQRLSPSESRALERMSALVTGGGRVAHYLATNQRRLPGSRRRIAVPMRADPGRSRGELRHVRCVLCLPTNHGYSRRLRREKPPEVADALPFASRGGNVCGSWVPVVGLGAAETTTSIRKRH